jgi:hypothetical protein
MAPKVAAVALIRFGSLLHCFRANQRPPITPGALSTLVLLRHARAPANRYPITGVATPSMAAQMAYDNATGSFRRSLANSSWLISIAANSAVTSVTAQVSFLDPNPSRLNLRITSISRHFAVSGAVRAPAAESGESVGGGRGGMGENPLPLRVTAPSTRLRGLYFSRSGLRTRDTKYPRRLEMTHVAIVSRPLLTTLEQRPKPVRLRPGAVCGSSCSAPCRPRLPAETVTGTSERHPVSPPRISMN